MKSPKKKKLKKEQLEDILAEKLARVMLMQLGCLDTSESTKTSGRNKLLPDL